MNTSIENKKKRLLKGRVISDSMNKTVVVAVERLVQHPVLKKFYKKTAKYSVHDENNLAKKENWVFFSPTRPISRRKSFVLDSILS